MAGRLAIIACGGDLPVRIAQAHPDALQISLEGIESGLEATAEPHRLEKLGGIFAALKAHGVGRVVLAGSLSRPSFDPTAFDAEMMALLPRVMMALPKGDDALLRQVIEIVEEQGFEVVAAHALAPDLVVGPELTLGPTPSRADEGDIARGAEILQGLSPFDLGQSCVVAGGLCLGIETVQGTDALLEFAAATPDKLRRGHKGVLIKAPKQGQDLRVDMPAIGPRTVQGAMDAGLSGIAVAAGGVMILERDKTLAAIENSGLFLVSRDM